MRKSTSSPAASPRPKDDIISGLLCHLAWLHKLAASKKARTVEWAFRVCNSAVELQFHFVYPHHEKDRVKDKTMVPLLAERIENVVELSRQLLDVASKKPKHALTRNLPIETRGGTELLKALIELLHAASNSGWREKLEPREGPRFYEPIDPLKKLKAYTRSPLGSAVCRSADRLPPEDPMADLLEGLAAKIVAEYSPIAQGLPELARKEFKRVANAVYYADQSQFVSEGGSQAQKIKKLAAALVEHE
jgi:hypothetical protein